MASKNKSNVSSGIEIGSLPVIRRSFGNVFVIPERNAGRYASHSGDPKELEKLQVSLMNVGMNDTELADGTDGTPEQIKAELTRRKIVLTGLLQAVNKAEKADKMWAQARYDVHAHYYAQEPTTWQFTGHQRYSQYPDAMAARLLNVRKNGWSAAGMAPIPGVDPTTATAAQIVQADYLLRYHVGLSDEAIEDIQIAENGGSVGITQMTAADYAVVYGRRWIKQGFVPADPEAWLMRTANLQRGKAQHATMIAKVAYILRDKYDVIGAATIAETDPDYADKYRNPLLWAGVSERAQEVRKLLIRMNSAELAAFNAKCAKNGKLENQMGPAKLDDLAAYVSTQFGNPPKSTALGWTDTVLAADGKDSCELVSSFIKACRTSPQAVTQWSQTHAQLIGTIRALESDNRKAKAAVKEFGKGPEFVPAAPEFATA